MSKREIRVVVEKISCYDLDNSALSTIKMLQAYVDKYGSNVYLEYEDDAELVVTYRRMETDKEYNKRIQCYQSRKDEIERKERETLEQLKKKYET